MRLLALLCLFAVACQSNVPASETSEPAPIVAPAPPAAEAPAVPDEEPVPAEPAAVEAQAPEEPEMETDCDVEVVVTDPDPAGLNVRSEPSVKGSIVGKIKKDPDGTVLTITSSKNGWLQVVQAEPMNAEPYEVRGWVSGQMTATMVRCPDDSPGPDCAVPLRSAPSESADEVARLPVSTAVTVVGCKGYWVEARTQEKAKKDRTQGWLERWGQCPNPVTTCP